MARIDDIGRGVAIGIGLALLIPTAVVVLAPTLKPAARAALKLGIRTAERGRELIAETAEDIEDLVSETRAELREEFNSAAEDLGAANDIDAEESEDGGDNVTPMKSTSEHGA